MPKKLSDGTNYYGPSFLGELYDGLTNTETWLYGEWNKEKLDAYRVLNLVPVFNDYMDMLLDTRSDAEYLNRYGMDYTDIHDPRKLSATASTLSMYRSSYNFVSRNINRLYR